ncbi:MAG: hypothetical protein V4754_05265 [Pseudomonadota bacterium]
MNIAKNMEAVFLVAAVLATAVNLATAGVPAFTAHQTVAAAHQPSQPAMPVVVVSAKRLSATQKLAAL